MTRWISTAEAWAHVAFCEGEKARQRINANLRTGAIPAWAKFFKFSDCEYRNAEMPIAFWDSHAALDYAKGEARRTGFGGMQVVRAGVIVPQKIPDDRAEGVCLGADALYANWPLAAITEKPKPVQRPHPGGRPPAADWPELEKALKAEIEWVGFPSRNGVPGWRTTADAVRFIEARLGDDEPGPTALRENVANMLARIKDEFNGN